MLRFKGGRFRIMQIADIQDTQHTSPDTLAFIAAALDAEKPDLVVFSGDQVKGYGLSLKGGNRAFKIERTIRNILSPVAARNIPFTFVFGNHDIEDTEDAARQQKIYESYPSCVNSLAFDRFEETEGICIPIYSAEGDTIQYCIYTINSHGTPDGRFKGVNDSQVEWTRQSSEALAAKEGHPVPAIVIQHIPVYEMYKILRETDKKEPGAIEGNANSRGHYYKITDEMAARGEYMLENIACGKKNAQFDGWVSQGNIKAAFFGHDHINCFSGELDGVLLAYTPGAGFNVYGPGKNRAVRIIDLSEYGSFSTHVTTYAQIMNGHLHSPVKYYLYNIAPSSKDDAIIKAKKYLPRLGAVVLAAAGTASAIKKIGKQRG